MLELFYNYTDYLLRCKIIENPYFHICNKTEFSVKENIIKMLRQMSQFQTKFIQGHYRSFGSHSTFINYAWYNHCRHFLFTVMIKGK